jgi:hypothetical protein
MTISVLCTLINEKSPINLKRLNCNDFVSNVILVMFSDGNYDPCILFEGTLFEGEGYECGSQIPTTTTQDLVYECTSDNTVYDTGGDSCLWYADNLWGCGNYDDSDFTSSRDCCECGGGYECASDYTNFDTAGDSCSWYEDNQD